MRPFLTTLLLALVTSIAPGQDRATKQQLDQARSLSRAFQYAAERIEPSVVHISTVAELTEVRRDVFGMARRFRNRVSGLGSGVIVETDGLILTIYHVIENATELIVRLHDEREFDARVVGADPIRDLALLRVEASGLTPATFGSSEDLHVGTWVLAAGSPFGFANSVTAGIVSAKSRGLGLLADEFKPFEEYIQTDASINPGNSGGPLIDLEGNVVGINTAIFSRNNGGSVGLGFAIPIDTARVVMESIRRNGRVEFGYIGVKMRDDPDGRGVRLVSVVPGSPAEEAGLRPGDFVSGFKDRPITTRESFRAAIQITPPGANVDLTVRRDGHEERIPVTIGDRGAFAASILQGRNVLGLGMAIADFTPRSRAFLDHPDLEGVVITSVEAGGAADAAHLEAEDVIIAIDDEAITSIEDFQRVMRGASLRRGVKI
ncbi:MAG: trypsin-like peptidase domain-containing protein, partial [Phycisphaerales bacterium]|nr:trypsin-like peptidase domain-containing protein [Phycisphaerales bacterium]